MARTPRFDRLATERRNRASAALDRMDPVAIASLMNREDARAVRAVGRVRHAVARAVDAIVAALAAGGRLFFVGAGTSGRLGVLEAAECPPTFGTPPRMVQAIMAGGRSSVFRSREGAEDDARAAARAVRRRVRRGDVAVGVIAPAPGPEVLAGSTRLKAGTATKLVLNTLTTASMARLGKVYGNRMVDVQPRSHKLRERALGLVMELGGVSRQRARRALAESGGSVRVAIVMARCGLSARGAARVLREAGGSLREALQESSRK